MTRTVLRRASLGSLAFAAACASFPGGDREICARLDAFEAASFEGLPESRRWVELHWLGYWLDLESGWGKQCRHSLDAESEAFCGWLIDNTSFEFATSAPMRILECRGYDFPSPFSSWGDWRAYIRLSSNESVATDLELNFADIPGETGVMRLSVFSRDDYPEEDLPPLGPVER